METRHTKEYAEKLAASVLQIKKTASYVQHNKIQHNRKYFIKGYMAAIKQTAAPELLEALIEIYDAYNNVNIDIPEPNLNKIINAIKKATT